MKLSMHENNNIRRMSTSTKSASTADVAVFGNSFLIWAFVLSAVLIAVASVYVHSTTTMKHMTIAMSTLRENIAVQRIEDRELLDKKATVIANKLEVNNIYLLKIKAEHGDLEEENQRLREENKQLQENQ